MSIWEGEVTESLPLTAADHYAGWNELAYYGMCPNGEPVNREEALANSIGWASRD